MSFAKTFSYARGHSLFRGSILCKQNLIPDLVPEEKCLRWVLDLRSSWNAYHVPTGNKSIYFYLFFLSGGEMFTILRSPVPK